MFVLSRLLSSGKRAFKSFSIILANSIGFESSEYFSGLYASFFVLGFSKIKEFGFSGGVESQDSTTSFLILLISLFLLYRVGSTSWKVLGKFLESICTIPCNSLRNMRNFSRSITKVFRKYFQSITLIFFVIQENN